MNNIAADRANSTFGLSPQDELNDLRMSDKALPLYEQPWHKVD